MVRLSLQTGTRQRHEETPGGHPGLSIGDKRDALEAGNGLSACPLICLACPGEFNTDDTMRILERLGHCFESINMIGPQIGPYEDNGWLHWSFIERSCS